MIFSIPIKSFRCRLGASSGFSLVEVVLALGVISFSSVAIFGVISVGFTGNYDALERASGMRTLGIVSNCLRATATAATSNNVTYTAANPFDVNWTLPVTSFSHSQYYITDNDSIVVAANKSTAHQLVDIGILPSVSVNAAPSALIVVAWPAASAQVSWSQTTPPVPTVSNAKGYEVLYVYLNAN